jgi:threonine aldolase
MLTGAIVTGIVPSNGVYLNVEDIKKHVAVSTDVHSCPIRVINLENTLARTIMRLEEVRKISEFAKKYDIKMHLDGARLWEVVAAGVGTLVEYASCFDTVSLCFSKGLGAPIGSIVIGSAEITKQAKWARQMLGGGLRQAGIIAAGSDGEC